MAKTTKATAKKAAAKKTTAKKTAAKKTAKKKVAAKTPAPQTKAAPAVAESGAEHPLTALRREVDRLFDNFLGSFRLPAFKTEPLGIDVAAPRVDLSEDDKAFHLVAEIPGMTKDDIQVTLSGNLLSISGEKKVEKEEKGKTFHRQERSYGSFRRSMSLPEEVDTDKVAATYKDGVLSVDLPKLAGPAASRKRVSIG
jgi:HSP20 family protein